MQWIQLEIPFDTDINLYDQARELFRQFAEKINKAFDRYDYREYHKVKRSLIDEYKSKIDALNTPTEDFFDIETKYRALDEGAERDRYRRMLDKMAALGCDAKEFDYKYCYFTFEDAAMQLPIPTILLQ